MRAVVQRVNSGSVTIDGEVRASIGKGFVILLGIEHSDGFEEIEKIWSKIEKLRIFEDSEGKTGADLAAVDGSVIIVSQFTLYADCKKGNRPSFMKAAAPDHAESTYDAFVEHAKRSSIPVQSGVFGAYMTVSIENDGPFTIILDTDELMPR